MKKGLFCLSLAFGMVCNTQVSADNYIQVFADDSLFLNYTNTEIKVENYSAHVFYQLKDRLPKGTYVLYSITRKDSFKKKLSDYLYGTGSYDDDSLRDGAFKYDHGYFGSKKNRTEYYGTVLNYRHGILDGQFVLRDVNGAVFLNGFYKLGKLDGMCVDGYLFSGSAYVKFYRNDNLEEWYYYHQEKLISRGYGWPIE